MGFDGTAVFLTFFIYAVLAVSYFGWGKFLFRMPGLRGINPEGWPVAFYVWLGWCVTLLLFQVIHFVFALNVYPVAVVFGIGVSLSRRYLAAGWNSFRNNLFGNTALVAGFVFICFAPCVWIASRAMLPPVIFDSGLYHLNSVRWTYSFPIVPGLGNLHGRLAYNQSFFSYVAALDFHPVFGYGRSIANSFLLILAAATMVELLFDALNQSVCEMVANLFKWGGALFSLPILAYFAMFSPGLASPTPNLASNLLQVALFAIFVRAIGEFTEKKRMPHSSVFIIGVMAATSITVKLSNLVFSAVLSLVIFACALKNSASRVRATAIMLVPAAMIITVSCCRGYVLSGAPLYPSTIGYVRTEWSVPVEKVENEARWIYSWARWPEAHPDQVLGNWNWLGPWIESMGGKTTEVVCPLSVFLVLCGVNAVLLFGLKGTKRKCLELIVPLPLVAGLVFWFFTAPDSRFAKATFLLLPASGMVAFLSLVKGRVEVKTFAWVALILFFAGNAHLLQSAISGRGVLWDVSDGGWHDITPVPLEQITTKSGLPVYHPKEGNQCWDSPLLCTPHFNKNLRLRRPDDLSSGFTLR